MTGISNKGFGTLPDWNCGLQFVADKLRGLRQIRRTLVQNGRLYLNLPGPVGPIFSILAEALEKLVSPQAADFIRHVFSLHGEDEIQHLLQNAGLRDVRKGAETKIGLLPVVNEFLWQYIQSTPLSALVMNQENKVRAALEQEVILKWQPFRKDGRIQMQQRIVTASARK